MAAVGVTMMGSGPVLVRRTCISSTLSGPMGTKLVTSARSPRSAFSRITRCQRKPASTVTLSPLSVPRRAIWVTPLPAADQGVRPATLTQKLRPARLAWRSSTETGSVKKLLWPLVMSPASRGETDAKMPASFISGK